MPPPRGFLFKRGFNLRENSSCREMLKYSAENKKVNNEVDEMPDMLYYNEPTV